MESTMLETKIIHFNRKEIMTRVVLVSAGCRLILAGTEDLYDNL